MSHDGWVVHKRLVNNWAADHWLVMHNSLMVSHWHDVVDDGLLVLVHVDMGAGILMNERSVVVHWHIVVLGVVHGLLVGLHFFALNIDVGTLTVGNFVMDVC